MSSCLRTVSGTNLAVRTTAREVGPLGSVNEEGEFLHRYLIVCHLSSAIHRVTDIFSDQFRIQSRPIRSCCSWPHIWKTIHSTDMFVKEREIQLFQFVAGTPSIWTLNCSILLTLSMATMHIFRGLCTSNNKRISANYSSILRWKGGRRLLVLHARTGERTIQYVIFHP